MKFFVGVSWPEGHGYLTRLPGGGTGIGLRERAQRFRRMEEATDAAGAWACLVAEVQRAQGKRRTNHDFTVEEVPDV